MRVLRIRTRKPKRFIEIPITYRVRSTSNGWETIFETRPTNNVPAEKLVVIHTVGGANRYLRRVRYGNRQPLLVDPAPASGRRSHLEAPDPAAGEWLFEAVFDYGSEPNPGEAPDERPWPVRRDPFSSYVAGFEIRTYRRCQRVLMFHRFAELDEQPTLVRSTDFSYTQSEPNGYSVLASVTQKGFLRKPGIPGPAHPRQQP